MNKCAASLVLSAISLNVMAEGRLGSADPEVARERMNIAGIEFGKDYKDSVQHKVGNTFLFLSEMTEHFACYKSKDGKKAVKISFLGRSCDALVSGVEISNDKKIVPSDIWGKCSVVEDSFIQRIQLNGIRLGAKKQDIEHTLGPMKKQGFMDIYPNGYIYQWEITDYPNKGWIFFTNIRMDFDSSSRLKSVKFYQYEGT